jgi:quercetin dioxygenase-like cupin family protein
MSTESGTSSPFKSWEGREPLALYPHVSMHASGGEQLLLGRVTYEPGAHVPRHSHEYTEQVMLMLDGEMEMTVGSETRTIRAGDSVVVNRGVEHELRSDGGCAFIEALSPVPLDHVPDPERDLVLGPDGGRNHVER